MQDGETAFFIRPYRPADRAAVRRICAATAWMGRPAPRLVGDDWIWAEYWTRYFTDREGRCCWVVQRGGRGEVVGYLTGTADARRFERYLPFLLPGIGCRAVRRRLMCRRESRRALLALLGSLARGEPALPPRVKRQFPATFHFNLLPPARRRGLGSRLVQTFLAGMRSAGAGGVHVQTLSLNAPAAAAMKRAGFRLLARRPIRAFAHVDPRPMAAETWVLRL